MSKFEEVRRVKKNLPFTVTPIPDISFWKLEQQRKEEAWQLRKEAKRQMVISMMESGALIEKEFKESATTKAYKRFEEEKKRWASNTIRSPKQAPPTLNWFEMVYDRFVNWLISFKF